MAFVVIGDRFFVVSDQNIPFRARPDQVHISAQYVDALRQLVHPGLSHKFAELKHPTIVFLRVWIMNAMLVHGSKFITSEIFQI